MKQIDPIVEELEAKENAIRNHKEKIPIISVEKEIDEVPVAFVMD